MSRLNREELETLADMVKCDGFGALHLHQETQVQVLDLLIQWGVSPRRLVEIIMTGRDRGSLLEKLGNHCRADVGMLSDFVEGILGLSAESWEGVDERVENIAGRFIGFVPNFDHLLLRYHDILTDPDHPLHSCVSPDTFWAKRVLFFVVRHDYVRAWEELRKAGRGLWVGEEKSPRFQIDEFDCGSCDYQFGASRKMMIELVNQLYGAMRERGLIIQPVPIGHFSLSEVRVKMPVYETRSPRGHRRKPRAYTQKVVVAGFSLARQHFLIQEGESRWTCRTQPWVFSEEGGKVFAMAAWYRQERNAKRRIKFQKATTDLLQKITT